MFKTNCGRLRQIALSDLAVRIAREGVVVEAKGLVKGDDLLSPQGMVYFEWKNWPPEILAKVRDLMTAAEKHVATTLSTGDGQVAETETANAGAERKAQEQAATPARPRAPSTTPGGAPLPPDLFDEEGEEGDIASSLEVDSQF